MLSCFYSYVRYKQQGVLFLFLKNFPTDETGPCKITVQFLQKVDRVDITHDNVCSSMLSCFYSYVAGTSNRASYF